MEPGPELDAAVATRVMGWKRNPADDPEDGTGCGWFDPDGDTNADCPAYSTDWRAAGEVWRKLVGRGCELTLVGDPDTILCRVEADANSERDYFDAFGKTEEHAICLAALAWADSQTETAPSEEEQA